MVSFELNIAAVKRGYHRALAAAGACWAAALVWLVLIAAQLLPDSLAGGILPYLVTLLAAACAAVVFVLLTRLSALAYLPYRVALDDVGLWVGEAYYSYTDLEQIGITAARPERTQEHRLVLRLLTGQTESFRLGTWRAGSANEVFAEYAQFVQLLTRAVQRHPRPIELFLL